MRFDEFAVQAGRYYRQNKAEMRYGQAVFNHLYEIRPDIADKLRGTKLDPFHDIVVFDEVWDFIEANW